MDSKDIKTLFEAYAAVYDENLRSEFENISLEEDLSFIDDLSDNELDEIMEDLFLSGEINVNECFDSLDYVLTEARVTSSDDRPSGSARVTTSAERPSKVKRTAERQREVRVGRLAQAAQRTGEKLASAARSKGTSVSGRVTQAKGKLSSAKEKVMGFLGKVGRAAKSGAAAAKKEFSGESGKEARARTTGREMRRVARRQAAASRGRDTSEFKGSPVGTSANPRIGQPGRERPALPAAKTKTVSVDRRKAAAAKLAAAAAGSGPSGSVQQGQPVGTFRTKKSRIQAQKREARLTAAESFELLDILVQDIINDGYVNSVHEAYDLIENLDDNQTLNLVESYLIEEVETVDLYDVVLEHLLDEGYADTIEAAEKIMVNMSEEWREEIVEASYSVKSARAGKDIGKPGKAFSKIAKEAGERYGSKERGEKVAGAVLAKIRAKHG